MEKIKGIIYACISAGTFGMIPLFANTAMREGVNNDTILVYRYVIAALVYGVYLAFRNISLKINRETLIELLWAGVGGYGITAYFLFLSYRYMPTGIATSIHYLYPVVVAVFMSLFYKQHLSIRVKGAIVLAILGVYFMSWSDGEIKWAGLIFALLTTFTYGTYIVALNRPHLKALNTDALTFYVLAFTALFYLLTAGLRRNLVLNFTPHFLFDMSMLGILSTVISARLLVAAVERIGSVATSVLGTLEPITAIIIGVFAFQEELGIKNFVGLLLVLIAVLIVILSMNERHKKKQRQIFNRQFDARRK